MPFLEALGANFEGFPGWKHDQEKNWRYKTRLRLQMENEIFIIDKLRDIFNQVDYGLKRYDSKTQIFIVYYEISIDYLR